MKKIIFISDILMWIITIIVFIVLVSAHGIWSIAPIYAYNRPQGVFGWLLAVTILLTVIDHLFFPRKPHVHHPNH